MSESTVMKLSELEKGGKAKVAELRGRPLFVSRACALGFTPGTEVLMVRNQGRGPLIAFLRDSMVALGRREAGGVYLQNPQTFFETE